MSIAASNNHRITTPNNNSWKQFKCPFSAYINCGIATHTGVEYYTAVRNEGAIATHNMNKSENKMWRGAAAGGVEASQRNNMNGS